jgi:TonB family protein
MKPRAAPRAPAGADPVGASPAPAIAARAPLSIIALSQDPMLLEALTLAAVGQASVVSSPSADRFADQLVATAAAVALIDAAAAPVPLDEFIASVQRQFPQLLLLLAGPAALQNQFAAQLTDGTIFRLAHKPASAQRLKLFVDAALLRRQALIDQAIGLPVAGTATDARPNAAAQTARSRGRRTLWLLASGVVILIATALGALLWRRPLTGAAPTPSDSNAAHAASPAALSAVAAPAATGAPTAPAAAAAAVSDSEAERDAIDRAAAERAERDQLISEGQRREAALAEQVRRTASSARAEQAHVYLQLARKRLASGALITPADDSARSYLQAALALAPNDADVQAFASALDQALRLASLAQAPGVQAAPAPESAPAVTAAATTPATTLATTQATASATPATVPEVVPESLLQRAHFVPPVYPPDALERGLSGTVDLEFTVAPTGEVTDIAIQAAEPHGVFEQAAVAALSHSRYRPVERDGVAIAQRARIRLRFQP